MDEDKTTVCGIERYIPERSRFVASEKEQGRKNAARFNRIRKKGGEINEGKFIGGSVLYGERM